MSSAFDGPAEAPDARDLLRWLRKAVDTTQIGITITDTTGRILYTNAAEAEMHGYTGEELLGRDARILSPPEDWRPVMSEGLRALRKWQRERVQVRKDGSTFPVRLLSDVVTGPEGEPVGIVTTCEDVSERRHAEEALRESEHRYRSLVDTAHDAIAEVDTDGRITSLNPAFEALTGWARSEWIGKAFEPVFHPEDRATAAVIFHRSLQGEAPQPAELRIVVRSGQTRAIEYEATPEIRDGRVVGIVTVARDVTERRSVEQRRTTRYLVTRVLAEASSLAEAAPRVLRGICVGLGWDAAALWIEDARESRLECLGLWHMPSVDGDAFEAPRRGASIPRGQGLLGRVSELSTPAWVQLPEPGGLRSAVVLPVASGARAVGVLELQGDTAGEPDADLLATLADIGGQIAQVVERRKAEVALRESEERYTLAARGANDGLWDWNLRTNEVYFSPRWKAMLGHDEAEIGSSSEEWFGRIHADDLPRVRTKLTDHLEGRAQHFEDEHRMRHKDGGYRWVFCRGFAARDAEGLACRMAGAETDVTDRRTFDALTGLPNRALFVERLGQALARARRRSGVPAAVLFVDIDRFKLVNDSLGHLAGDQLLVAAARRLEACVRPGDTVGRFGGDEFGILLDGTRDVADAIRVADRIQVGLRAPFDLEGHEVFASASVGIALCSTGHEAPEDLIRNADTAMYRAKALGKARYEVFDEDMRARVVARLELETDLRRAMERRELVVHYQPVVRLSSGRLAGFETLLRWRHPRRGLVLPSGFIPLAEETGLIVPIGYWALREACSCLREWRGRFANAALSVSVNLTARQFSEPDLPAAVEQVLHETGLDPRSLRLEITEGILMETTQPVGAALSRLKALGILIDIDDFGTGYSSLSLLHRFPVDTLKVDRSFIGRMNGGNGEDAAIVRTILGLARTLHIEVIAEGVETGEQLARLRALRCHEGQGTYFAPPLEAQEAEGLLLGGARWHLPPTRRAHPPDA